jgi:Na+/H+-translocating membrane pyrophosphatase
VLSWRWRRHISGGRGSSDPKATVAGDAEGDPFRETAGPCLNILTKLMSMVSVVSAGLVVKYAPWVGGWMGPR